MNTELVSAMFTFFHNPFIAILKGAGPPGAPRGHFTLHRARDVTQLRGTRSRSLAEPNVYWLWCYNANTRIKTLQQDSHMSTTHDGQLALCKGRKQQMATLNTLKNPDSLLHHSKGKTGENGNLLRFQHNLNAHPQPDVFIKYLD